MLPLSVPMKQISLMNHLDDHRCLFGLASASQAATINLAWNSNTEKDLAGDVVWYGTQSGTYTTSIDAANNASQSVTNLVNGTQYYFVVRLYNTSGMFSGASQIISGVAASGRHRRWLRRPALYQRPARPAWR